MNFIKKILDKRVDDSVHQQFQKFSRGQFRNRAMIKAKKTGKNFTINTTPEFANEFVKICAEKLEDKKTKIAGAVVSTLDLTGKLNFKEKKQFQGVKRYIIDNEMSGTEIINLLDEFPKAFFGLSFEVDSETKLKIKPKAPKSGKPGSKAEESPKIDFCKLITTDKKIADSFIFEKPDFKEAEIKHVFVIEEIIIPEEIKKTGDFARMREEARRKGKIIREAEIDGSKFKKEIEFEA